MGQGVFSVLSLYRAYIKRAVSSGAIQAGRRVGIISIPSTCNPGAEGVAHLPALLEGKTPGVAKKCVKVMALRWAGNTNVRHAK